MANAIFRSIFISSVYIAEGKTSYELSWKVKVMTNKKDEKKRKKNKKKLYQVYLRKKKENHTRLVYTLVHAISEAHRTHVQIHTRQAKKKG